MNHKDPLWNGGVRRAKAARGATLRAGPGAGRAAPMGLRAARLLLAISIPLIFALPLAACKSGNGGPAAIPDTITGVVSAPAADKAQFAMAGARGVMLAWIGSLLGSTAAADVTGLEPVGNATVELVRLDSLGNVLAVLDTTTSDGSGAYTFTNTPAPSSTLAVRVTGQLDTMRAIATGARVDISPISEVVTDTVVAGLGGGVVLENFAPDEIDALSDLVAGMDIDVSGQTFGEAVTSIRGASTPILPDLARGYSTAGVATILRNKGYNVLDLTAALKDPYSVSAGGLEAAIGYGGLGFGNTDRAQSGGMVVRSPLLHDLASVGPPSLRTVNTTGLAHVVASTGQVTVGGVGGAVTQDGSLMVYPLDGSAPGEAERGLRFAIGGRSYPATTVLDNTLLDAPLGGATVYNLVRLRERLSGIVSGVGANAIAAVTATGTLSFDSDVQTDRGGSTYGELTSGGLTTSPLALDLDSYAVTSGPAGADSPAGIYRVFPDGSFIFLDTSGGFYAQGGTAGNGEILAFLQSSDVFQSELDVLANDTDAVGDALTITAVTQPAKGTVAIQSGGKRLLYTAKGDDTLGESFGYTVRDAAGLEASATVTVGLIAVNAAPTGFPDSFTVNADTSGNLLDVLANDTDAVGELTVTVATQPANGTAVWDSSKRKVSYTPTAGYGALAQELDSFTYTVWDQGGLSGGPVTVNLTVGPNAAPVANADNFAVNSDTSANTLDVLANDVDAVGDLANVTIASPATYGTAVANGGTVSYTPNPGYSGPDNFTYTVEDKQGVPSAAATVSLTVGANAAPTATADSFDVDVDAQGERVVAVGIRQGSAMGNADVAGTYNLVQHASYLAETGGPPPTSATVDTGFKYGTLVFDGINAVTGGSLFRKRASLDIATAKAAVASALTALPTPAAPESPSGGSYSVIADGRMTLSLTIGTETVTGTGAVSQSGEFIVLAIESTDSGVAGVNGGRGLLLLMRQPP